MRPLKVNPHFVNGTQGGAHPNCPINLIVMSCFFFSDSDALPRYSNLCPNPNLCLVLSHPLPKLSQDLDTPLPQNSFRQFQSLSAETEYLSLAAECSLDPDGLLVLVIQDVVRPTECSRLTNGIL